MLATATDREQGPFDTFSHSQAAVLDFLQGRLRAVMAQEQIEVLPSLCRRARPASCSSPSNPSLVLSLTTIAEPRASDMDRHDVLSGR